MSTIFYRFFIVLSIFVKGGQKMYEIFEQLLQKYGVSAYKVSKAKEDLPDPERPVITHNLFLGILKVMFFKLWVLAPRTVILSMIYNQNFHYFLCQYHFNN